MYANIMNMSQIKSFKRIFFLAVQGSLELLDMSKMSYSLQQNNWGCIIKNQLQFAI